MSSGILKIMVSSTIRDLPKHREAVRDACERQKMFPLMMEHLAARETTPIETSLKMVDEADVYLGVIAYRYGMLREGQDISITEEEYERAKQRRIPRLIFLIDRMHPITIDEIEQGIAGDKLDAFKKKLQGENTVNFFASSDDLRAKVINSLAQLREQDLTSFHYATEIPRPPEIYIAHPYILLQTQNLVGRRSEIKILNDWIQGALKLAPTQGVCSSNTLPVLAFVAIGGMGKSAVTWKWFNDVVPKKDPRLAGRVWWSFYESDAHFENFVIRTLTYTSRQKEEDIRRLSPTRRQRQLLDILDREPFLLVLDGLERILLAYARLDASRLSDEDLDEKTANIMSVTGLPVETGKGFASQHRLRNTSDPRAGVFLRALSQVNASRVLITTRLFPTALQTQTGVPIPGSCAFLLPGLSPEDAVQLWHTLGASGSKDELLRLFETFNFHPLLIQALASEVAHYRRAPGDFETWQNNHPNFDPFRLPLVQRKSHVLAFALRGLGKQEREVLDTIAAFRMPTTYDTLAALLVGPDCCYASESELDLVLSELEDRGLVGWDRRANRYDLHPIVRGVTWSSLDEATRKQVYESLNKHFESIPPQEAEEINSIDDLTADLERYSTLVGLSRYEEAYTLFLERLRDVLLYRLAANRYCAELLEGLFSREDSQHPELEEKEDCSYVLNALGLAYFGLGDLERALKLFGLSNRLDGESGDRQGVAIGLCNRAHLFLLMGKLRTAEREASEAIKLQTAEREAPETLEMAQPQKSLSWKSMGQLEKGLIDAARGSLTRLSILERTKAFGIRAQHLDTLSHEDSLTCAYLAQGALWSENAADALSMADMAWQLAERTEQDARLFILAARLQGVAALATGDEQKAQERLHTALASARRVNWAEDEIASLIGLAELAHRQQNYRDARELLSEVMDLGERGSYRLLLSDAYNILARIEYDSGNSEASVEAAMNAYNLAWCDAPPYSYHHGLSIARSQLNMLGATEPRRS